MKIDGFFYTKIMANQVDSLQIYAPENSNYVYVKFPLDNFARPFPKADVKVKPLNLDVGSEQYEFYGPAFSVGKQVLLSNITDQNDGAYTVESFTTFYEQNTGAGFKQPSGGGGSINSVTGPDVTGTATDRVVNRSPDFLENVIVVTQANVSTTLGGTIDSSKQYFIDGIIDCSGVSIEIPSTGITLNGYNFNQSALVCADDNYTMFTSPVGGSGDILGTNYAISVTGTNSKVYDLVNLSGLNAFEFAFVNYTDCTSLGSIAGYRQGLEEGTGRFGGRPQLELIGNWAGGYRITTSIVRILDDGIPTEYSLFKAGTGLVFNSRFLTDINCDLPVNVNFSDFSSANFAAPSLLQLRGAILSRNGVVDAMANNFFPNIDHTSLQSLWMENVGIRNTHVGGVLECTSETETVISTINTFEPLLGTFTANDLQHFSFVSGTALQHDGNTPVEFEVRGEMLIEGPSNNDITLRLMLQTGIDPAVEVDRIQRTVNNLQGGRDVAIFNFSFNPIINQA